MSVLKFHSNKLLSFEDIEILIFSDLAGIALPRPLI